MKKIEKIYFALLLIFTCLLNGCVLTLALISRAEAYKAMEDKLLAQQQIFAETLAENITAVSASRPQALQSLYEVTAQQWSREGVFFAVKKSGEIQYSNLPQPDMPLPEMPPQGQRTFAILRSGAQRYFYVVSAFSAADLICAFPIEPFFTAWQKTMWIFQGAALGVSVLLGIALWALCRGSLLLQAAAQEKQNLVDNLSHELRTPLTAIAGYADYMQRAELSEEEKYEATDTIISEAKRLQTMADKLLQMSAARTQNLVFETVQAYDLLANVQRILQPKAQASAVAVSVFCEEDQTVFCVPDLMESLLVNLADNAIKACEKGGAVTLRAAQSGITVTDNGCGMSEQTLAHLGEPFYRADKARARADGGAGIGVSLCFEIARTHKMKLHFVSQPQKGTQAVLTFTR